MNFAFGGKMHKTAWKWMGDGHFHELTLLILPSALLLSPWPFTIPLAGCDGSTLHTTQGQAGKLKPLLRFV